MSEMVTYASLIVAGGKVDSGRLAELTGCKSDNSKHARADLWIIRSRGKVDSKLAEDHINWLLDGLQQYIPQIVELFSPDRLEVSCYWFSGSGHGGPVFSSTLIKRLAANGLSLWIDTYSD